MTNPQSAITPRLRYTLLLHPMGSVTGTAPREEHESMVEAASLGSRLVSTLKYLFTTEVHAYAFAIAANVLLSFIPFAVLLLTFCKSVLHSKAAANAIIVLLRDALPSNQEFIAGLVQTLAKSHKAQAISLGMLLFSSTGIFLPLEVALNRVWGFPKNRSYIRNQALSLALAFGCGLLALLSVLLTAAHLSAIHASFGRIGWTGAESATSYLVIKLTALPTTILVLFLFYYVMPNGKVPFRPVLFAAVFGGLLIEAAKHLFMQVLPWLNFQDVYDRFFVSVTMIMWAFVAALVLLAGAHFSASRRGKL